jgi:hypothetical protein
MSSTLGVRSLAASSTSVACSHHAFSGAEITSVWSTIDANGTNAMSHNGQVELHLHDEITGLTPAGRGSFRQLSRRSEKGTKGTALRSRAIAESHSRRDPGLMRAARSGVAQRRPNYAFASRSTLNSRGQKRRRLRASTKVLASALFANSTQPSSSSSTRPLFSNSGCTSAL